MTLDCSRPCTRQGPLIRVTESKTENYVLSEKQQGMIMIGPNLDQEDSEAEYLSAHHHPTSGCRHRQRIWYFIM